MALLKLKESPPRSLKDIALDFLVPNLESHGTIPFRSISARKLLIRMHAP